MASVSLSAKTCEMSDGMKDPLKLPADAISLKVDNKEEESPESEDKLRATADNPKPFEATANEKIVLTIKLAPKDVEFKEVKLPVRENVGEVKVLAKSTTTNVKEFTNIKVSVHSCKPS